MGVYGRSILFLEILEGTFLVRILLPWFESLGKRLVKSPKVYMQDSGILHGLLGIADWDGLLSHPAAGASWEGFAIETVLARVPDAQAYFWGSRYSPYARILFRSDIELFLSLFVLR